MKDDNCDVSKRIRDIDKCINDDGDYISDKFIDGNILNDRECKDSECIKDNICKGRNHVSPRDAIQSSITHPHSAKQKVFPRDTEPVMEQVSYG